jgi:hypothetical protein
MTSTEIVPYKGPPLVKYDAACKAIAECASVDEVKGMQDLAAAAQAYARQADDSEMLTNANRVRLRAQRRCGELLIEMADRGERAPVGGIKGGKKIGGERAPGNPGSKWGRSDPTIAPPVTVKDLGLSRTQAKRWQTLAKLPEKEFEAKVTAAGAVDKPKKSKSVPSKPRKTRVTKATGAEPSLKQQVNAYHHEAVSVISDFRDRFLPWFGAHPKLNSAQREVLKEAFNLCANEFTKLVQAVDGR